MAAFKTFLQVSEKFSPLVVDCYQFDFDGTHFGPVQTTFRIKRFEDVQKIDSLAVFPANFISDVDLLKRNLRARGKKFLELCSLDHVVHKEYEGLSLDNPPEQIESQIIVDFDMASRIPNEQQPKGKGWVPRLGLDGPTKPNGREINGRSEDCKFSDCPFCEAAILDDQSDDQKRSKAFILGTTHLSGAPIRSEHLNGEDCMLLNARVLGFVLRNRKWARLHVDNISPVERHENNFDKLVLPRGYRKIVRALVETHFKTTDSDTKEKARHNADLVRGKGKGLIILLHGAPGVGKTSTAECVAEHTQRPLFAITCGDIGETAAEVEKNLDRCFQMAHRWGCVLLLDEADVFLAQRDKTDLRRNAIVSVFLRVLEYYAGILFLTTNRVGSFDQAFKSRIHMSLLYPILDQKSTRKIWQMNLDRAIEKQKELGLIIDKGNIMDFADDHWKESEEGESGYWNGRQIRNAFQTAIALAQWERKESNSEAIELNRRHFIKVSKAARSFDAYLNKVYGGQSEAEKAVELSERFDKWDTDEVTSKKHAKYKEKRIAGKNVAFFGGSKKGKDKKSKKEESCSDSESDSPQQRRQKKFSESESITDE
ncbi:P-loop containing nucleoside triphosphate hydrolase protein [Acephala macrosclerotiorum]|nr:P-loop containing nucleoside triphosphate hydrolase protein [Acephala macrosclerotiorum]